MSEDMHVPLPFVLSSDLLELAEGAEWQKAQRSGPCGNCVETVLLKDGNYGLRNSRSTDGPVLIFTPAEMAAHVDGMAKNEIGVDLNLA